MVFMRKGAIVYTHSYRKPSTLYVNLTPRYACVNKCVFCDKNALERYVGAKLLLSKAPTAKDVLKELQKKASSKTREIVFCGIGEPTLYLNTLLKVTRGVKNYFPSVRVRVNTNGQAELINKNRGDVARALKNAGVDEVSVSLNALTPGQYQRFCRSRFGRKAFWAVLKFVRHCKRAGIKTSVSFVEGYPGLKINKKAATALARSLGVRKENVLFRQFVSGSGRV
ncbi:MAG: TatD family nuclease-associated radical SAM protein [Candidatus Norongarragalinales archaeon]